MPISRNTYSSELNFFGKSNPSELLAKYGSPLYIYNEDILRERCRQLRNLIQLPGFMPCYSSKANSNPHLLRIIREEGFWGDAMSPGEIALLHEAGYTKDKICYVCNNVSEDELRFAVANSLHVSVDSLSQLESFGRVNNGGSIMLRVNPGIGAGHSSKVVTAGDNTKFGISLAELTKLEPLLAKYNLRLTGLNQHVGSLFMDPAPYLAAAEKLLEAANNFPDLEYLDFGGGFGIPYHKYAGQTRLDIQDLSARLTGLLENWAAGSGFKGHFIIESGRYICAEAGLLLGTVHAVKGNGKTRYVGTDIGFSTLIRPTLYQAFHDIETYPQNNNDKPELMQTIVGNICESGDILAEDRLLPELFVNDKIGVLDAGAYCHSMSSNYNQRFRPAEVLIDSSGENQLIRRRDSIEDLLSVYP